MAFDSPGYPPGLTELRDPPPCVFVRGGPLPAVAQAVAIVGARAASGYGMEQARRLAGDLARLGLTVVSGLARGIDAAAHRGALAAGGRTVAVIPSGLDAITPRHHRELAGTIAAHGALVSERERGDPPFAGEFVRRNRLIAALAGATVVVEAAERSGALTTAAAARRLGRPVLAVPGDVDRETTRGCHALIRGGARLCERAADVLSAFEWRAAPAEVARGEAISGGTGSNDGAIGIAGGSPEARLMAVLDGTPRTVEALAVRSGLEVAQALAALLALQWAGVAAPRPGQRWVRSGT